jgi:hypothetical protein
MVSGFSRPGGLIGRWNSFWLGRAGASKAQPDVGPWEKRWGMGS